MKPYFLSEYFFDRNSSVKQSYKLLSWICQSTYRCGHPIFGFESRPKYKEIGNNFLKDYSKLTELVCLTGNKYITNIITDFDAKSPHIFLQKFTGLPMSTQHVIVFPQKLCLPM